MKLPGVRWPNDGGRNSRGSDPDGFGQDALYLGKPYPYMFRQALRHVEDWSRAVMFGDTPDTDIVGAHRMGISAVLISSEPYTGYSSARDYRSDAIIPDLRNLLDEELRLERWVPPAFPWPDEIKSGVAGIVLDERGRVLLMKRADNGC